MNSRHRILLASASALSLACMGAWSPAVAAEAGADAGGQAVEEVIVTARKRAESDIAVPAVITAYSPEKLTRAGANDMYSLARMTPQLIIANNAATFGGSISLRGVGSSAVNGIDQTVAVNIDGVAVSNAAAARIGYFDLRQVEILKGPQALFFGKNATGGIISFRSEDPGSTRSGYLRGSYELNADEYRLEGAVGGPVTDWLKARVAAYVGQTKGYFKNPLPKDFPDPLVVPTSYDRVPYRNEFGYRATLLATPTDKLTANFKATFIHSSGSSAHAEAQLGSCPLGTSQASVALYGVYAGDCTFDKTTQPLGDASAAGAAGLRLPQKPAEHNQQFVSSLNIDYELTPELTLTSVTGYYNYLLRGMVIQVGPRGDVLLASNSEQRDASQELRLTSDFGGRFDFMVGGFFQRSVYHTDSDRYVAGPILVGNYKVPGFTYSAFAQGTFRVSDTLELAGGARYTELKKRITAIERRVLVVNDVTSRIPVTEFTTTDVSPEVTLTYRPTSDLTLFAAYKEGFKGGGFNPSVVGVTPGARVDYGPEYARGFEGGVKARLFDRQMRVDISIYNYTYDDLQVSAFDATLSRTLVQNAASAKVKGVDFNMNYQPAAVRGLSFEVGVGYNHARFDEFKGACYTGQTIALGCNLDSLNGRFQSQDLSGRPLPSAPDWSGNVAVSYDFEVAKNIRLDLGVGLRFVDSYNPAGDFTPFAAQKAAHYWDARARLYSEDDRWDLALIGRNLTDEMRAVSVFAATGGGTAAGLPTGTRADLLFISNRPWEVRMQLTLRPAFLNP
ncbi:TonB-dependent receptor [Phenylobacterium sp.]|uniref:TonB-dependent receptor n=1 Tax=Phenylobacterium sp. TaxID=1871053 RepID=UPI00301B9D6E